MERKKLIDQGYKIFSEFKRPKNFHSVHRDDPESGDHEFHLQKRNRTTLELEDVARGMTPITAINAEGMAYFMPRLIEFALNLEQISQKSYEPYLWEFTLQLMPRDNETRFSLFRQIHIDHIRTVLAYIKRHHFQFIVDDCFEEEFKETVIYWNEMKNA